MSLDLIFMIKKIREMKKYNFNTLIGRLKIIAIAEGISYLLLGVTMPLKYMADLPQPNFIIGLAHGLLFILYILLVIQCAVTSKWSLWKTFLAFVASLIPFGTFVADRKLF